MKAGRRLRASSKGKLQTTLPSGELIWALDLRDQRRVWQSVHPEAGLTLRQAMFYYDQENLADLFLELDALGYGGDPPLEMGVDGWPTDKHVLSDFRVSRP